MSATRPLTLGLRVSERVLAVSTAVQTLSTRVDAQQLMAQASFSSLGAAVVAVVLVANVAYTQLSIKDIFAIALPSYGPALNSEALNTNTLG
jgi:putative copper export protein